MNRIAIVVVSLVLAVPAVPSEGSTLWGCSQGDRRNVLYLADRGRSSYVKVGRQRVDATVTSGDDDTTKWTFGSNYVLLHADGQAEYFENGTHKGDFRCHKME
jgi:hypothetical protein